MRIKEEMPKDLNYVQYRYQVSSVSTRLPRYIHYLTYNEVFLKLHVGTLEKSPLKFFLC